MSYDVSRIVEIIGHYYDRALRFCAHWIERVQNQEQAQTFLLIFLAGIAFGWFLRTLLIPGKPRETRASENPGIRELYIGAAWLVIMMCLDLYFGRFVFKLKWGKILDDFNPGKGNLLGIGLLFLLFCPTIVFWSYS